MDLSWVVLVFLEVLAGLGRVNDLEACFILLVPLEAKAIIRRRIESGRRTEVNANFSK